MRPTIYIIQRGKIKGQFKELVCVSEEEVRTGMHLAGVSVRRVEDMTESFWSRKESPFSLSC